MNGEIFILDLPRPHIKNHAINIELDIQEESKIVQRYSNFFDFVYCIDVAQYWWIPNNAIRNISQFMKPDASLVISFPSLYPWHKPTGKDYLRYSRDVMEKLLESNGIEVIEELPIRLNIISRLLFLIIQILNRNRIDFQNPHRFTIGFILLCKKIK